MDKNDELIRLLIKRVYHLEQEVIKLGGQPYVKQADEAEIADNNTAETIVQDNTVKNSPITETVSEKMPQQRVTSISQIKKTATDEKVTVNKVKSQKQNMENKIGKNVMGIMASILIFFSLVLFAGIAFNYLSDIAKVVIMFAISIGIAVFGIVKMPKKKDESISKYKTFYTTLAACGIGAIYITDLVAYFGFKCMSLVPFIVSLLIWILVTMYLAYKCSAIFVYICNIGLIIATFLTAIQFNNGLLGFIIYTVCLTALYFINKHEDFNKDSFYFIQYPIVFIALSYAVDTLVFNYVVFLILLLVVFTIANLLYTITNRQMAVNIVTALLNIVALVRICSEISNDVMNCIAVFILIAMMALYFVKHYKTNKVLFYIIFYIAYMVSAGLFLNTDLYIMIALLPFILFLLAGFILKDLVIRIGGYFALIVSFMIQLNFYESWFVLAFYLFILAIVIFALIRIQYSVIDKYILTGIALIYIADIATVFSLNICITFALFGLFTALLNSKYYHINPKSSEKEPVSEILGYVSSATMILTGMSYMFSSNLTPEIYQVVIISLITLLICLINTKRLYKTSIPEMPLGFYQCIKFSLWIYIVLHRLKAASFVISIVGILIAISCIVLGFAVKQKSFRLYGLIVSLVSVVKLILFDISYDSNILRPVGFFIAGVLCFAISFIYSKLEKGITSEEKE